MIDNERTPANKNNKLFLDNPFLTSLYTLTPPLFFKCKYLTRLLKLLVIEDNPQNYNRSKVCTYINISILELSSIPRKRGYSKDKEEKERKDRLSKQEYTGEKRYG